MKVLPLPVRAARQAYRLVARLYPPYLARTYGDEMARVFEAQARDRYRQAGAVGVAGLVLVTAWGALRARMVDGRPDRDGRAGGVDDRRGGGAVAWMSEFRFAGRRLRRTPGFTAVAVLTLALGVGAFASVAGVAVGILVRPMPYEQPDDLYWVWRDYWGAFTRGWVGGPDVVRLRQETPVQAVVAFRTGRANLAGLAGTDPQDVRVTLASPGFLETLGRAPRLGAGFTPVDHAPDAPAEVVLSDGLWRTAFGADASVLGRQVLLDGEPHRVVGVMPPDFDFVVHSSLGEPQPADLYAPLDEDLSTWSVGSGSFGALLRTRPGAPAAEVDAALARVSRAMDDEFFGNRGFRLWRVSLRDDLVGDVRAPLLALMGSSALLVLILGANLATLFLARAHGQTHDAAVRAALGAGRSGLVRPLAADAALVAAGGLAGGMLMAVWGSALLQAASRDLLPRAAELGTRWPVVAAAAGCTVLLALLALAGPAARLARTPASPALREGGRGGESRRHRRARSGLVVVQLALALTLVVGAGLLTRSLASLLREDPGFDPGTALTFRVAFSGPAYGDSASVIAAQETLLERLRALPGVAAVGMADALPLGLETNQGPADFPASPVILPDDQDGLADFFSVTPGYVHAAGLRVLEGRALDGSDARNGGVLVDDVLARRAFPQGGALGATLVMGGDSATVVGVVDQARFYDVFKDDRGQVYIPRARDPRAETYVVVRWADDLDPLNRVAEVRDVVSGLDPTLPLAEIRPLRRLVSDALGGERLQLILVAAFAGAALVLAGLGLYGVVSGSVLQRRREIGIRMAVGADGGRVVGLVLAQGARVALAGTAAGLVAAWALGRFLSSLLYGVAPFDPLTYAGAAGVLGALALLATWLPAWRATRIRPLEALRTD